MYMNTNSVTTTPAICTGNLKERDLATWIHGCSCLCPNPLNVFPYVSRSVECGNECWTPLCVLLLQNGSTMHAAAYAGDLEYSTGLAQGCIPSIHVPYRLRALQSLLVIRRLWWDRLSVDSVYTPLFWAILEDELLNETTSFLGVRTLVWLVPDVIIDFF